MSSDSSGYDFFTPAPPGAETGSAPVAHRGPMVGPTGGPLGRVGTPSHLAPTTSRWAKSDVTFGPLGRIVTTIFMVLPLLFFVGTGVFTGDPFVLVGAVIWGGLMVVGMRHVWAAVRR